MKNLFDGEHKKSKIALAAVLVGALVLPLCSCGMGGIEGKALKYLASRYSGEFTIISAERESDVNGPIPVFYSTSHWVLTATSNQFPNDTFTTWRREKEQLEKEMPTLRSERARVCHDLAFAEVISYNRANLERVEQNENRQQTISKIVGRAKRREEEI